MTPIEMEIRRVRVSSASLHLVYFTYIGTYKKNQLNSLYHTFIYSVIFDIFRHVAIFMAFMITVYFMKVRENMSMIGSLGSYAELVQNFFFCQFDKSLCIFNI